MPLRCISCLVLLIAASPALGQPSSVPDAVYGRAETAFEGFVADWMKKVRTMEREARSKPTVEPGATDPVFTYRGYGDRYSIELRPTGQATAPYVGLLRYTEHVYSCHSVKAEVCSVASTVPVTEIFRYRKGRWSY
jgi:hypothetical protein